MHGEMEGGRDENFQCPSKNHCPFCCIRLPFVCDCLFLTTTSPLRGPCPGLWALSPWLCRECGVFRAVEEGREWANGRWPLREPGKWNGRVGEMAGIPPPPSPRRTKRHSFSPVLFSSPRLGSFPQLEAMAKHTTVARIVIFRRPRPRVNKGPDLT